MVRPAHIVCLLLAGIPLVRYSEIAIKERVARASDSSEEWTLRSDLLARSQVFVTDGTGIGSLDLSKSPRDAKPLDPMGVKAAGGVRDLEGLKAMVAAGASRVGASAGVKIVQQSQGNAPAATAEAPKPVIKSAY